MIAQMSQYLGEIVERCTIGHFQTLSTLNHCRIAPYICMDFRFHGYRTILKKIDGAFRKCILLYTFSQLSIS